MDISPLARTIAAECLCFRSRRLARMITRFYDRSLRAAGVEATQLTVLAAVAHGGAEGARMGRIADELALDLSSLSRNLKPLERQGAVEIAADAADRRARIVRMTAKGERLLEEAWPLWRAATDRLIGILGPGTACALRDDIDRAGGRLRGERSAA